MTHVFFGLSPILVVALGALLLMLAEAFGKPAAQPATATAGGAPAPDPFDAGAGRSAELSIGATVVLLAGAVFAIGVWLVGPDKLTGLEVTRPYLVIDRFTIFFCFVLCLGGALGTLLAGGYLP